jgi:hypothetical protein
MGRNASGQRDVHRAEVSYERQRPEPEHSPVQSNATRSVIGFKAPPV